MTFAQGPTSEYVLELGFEPRSVCSLSLSQDASQTSGQPEILGLEAPPPLGLDATLNQPGMFLGFLFLICRMVSIPGT